MLFKANGLPAWSAAGAGWDVSPDGKNFLFPIPVAADADRAVHAGAELNLSSQEMTGQVLGCPHNRPISAHSQGVLSLRASVMILVRRLESRSRQVRETPFGNARRNISRTC